MSSAASSAVFDRRNKPIQEAFDNRNYKQALQLCEKRIKKGENTLFLQAWRAKILFSFPDESHRQRGIDEALKLYHQNPNVSEPDVLNHIYNVLVNTPKYEELGRTLYERSAKSNPQLHGIQETWLCDSLDNKDYKGAQRAAMALQKISTKRKHYFWAILMTWFVGLDQEETPSNKILFSKLAASMIQKSALETPKEIEPNKPLSPKAIKDPNELLLLVRIFQSERRWKELLEILESDNLGTESTLGKGTFEFIEAKLNAMQELELYDQLLLCLKSLLQIDTQTQGPQNEMQSQWRLWQFMAETTIRSWKKEAKSSFDFISTFLERYPGARSPLLAFAELSIEAHRRDEISSDELGQRLNGYFDKTCSQPYCFSDLRRLLAKLGDANKHLLQKVLDHAVDSTEDEQIATSSGGLPRINTFKLVYCYQLKFDDPEASRHQTDIFIARCLQLYRLINQVSKPPAGDDDAPKPVQPRDDLCVLAAMAMVKQHPESAKNPCRSPRANLITASIILRHLLVFSPHNHESRLLLTRLHLLLGAASIAMEVFASLNVKQLQTESVLHNLLTRMVTIHPQAIPVRPGGSIKDYDPFAALVYAHDFYRRSDVALQNSVQNALKTGAYVNAAQSVKLQNTLESSFVRTAMALDERKLRRMIHDDPYPKHDKQVFKDPITLHDNRTSDGFMNCESPFQPEFEEHVRVGPRPGRCWVKSAMLTDCIYYYLYNRRAASGETTVPDPSQFGDITSIMRADELTPCEMDNLLIQRTLFDGVYEIRKPNSQCNLDTVQASAEKSLVWLSAKIKELSNDTGSMREQTVQVGQELRVPSWIYFHVNYSLVDTITAIERFYKAVEKSPVVKGLSKPSIIPELRENTARAFAIMRTNTVALKSGIQALSTMIQGITETMLTHQTEMLQSEMDMLLTPADSQVLAKSLGESWIDGLNGLLQTIPAASGEEKKR